MKIKRFNELNESSTQPEKTNLELGRYMKAGDLMDYLRRNIPKETVIFYRPNDSPISLMTKEDIEERLPEIEDIYIYENDEDSYEFKEFGKYSCYDSEDEERKGNTIRGNVKDIPPKIVKGIVINKYM